MLSLISTEYWSSGVNQSPLVFLNICIPYPRWPDLQTNQKNQKTVEHKLLYQGPIIPHIHLQTFILGTLSICVTNSRLKECVLGKYCPCLYVLRYHVTDVVRAYDYSVNHVWLCSVISLLHVLGHIHVKPKFSRSIISL